MYGDTWQVRWKEFLSDSYVYGSKIVATSNSATDLAIPRKDNAYVAGICSHLVFYDEFPGE